MKPPPPTWAFIALGSNQGNPEQQIRAAMDRLRAFSSAAVRTSSLWQSEPVDCPSGSPPFVNAIVGLVPLPEETPETLLRKLQLLEQEFGRRPARTRNGPRPLDLDLIAFGNERRSEKQLCLPHPRAHLRAFVLAPLSEIAPDLILPGQRQSARQLLAQLARDEWIQRLENSTCASGGRC